MATAAHVRLRGRLRAAASFVRFSAIGGTLILPLLGAAAVSPQLSLRVLSGLIGIGLVYHVFAYVLNDVVDLPIDRTEPRRAASPLVRGTVQPWQALTVALLQVPLAVALTVWLHGGARAFVALVASFLLGTAYNLWGKRARFPPMTDLIQGLGWGALSLWGGAIVGQWTARNGIVFWFVVVFILMANGVHGSLRDIVNDHRCGVRSTAIVMGARPDGSSGVLVPRRITVYAFVLQAMLTGIVLLSLARNDFGYPARALAVSSAAVLLVVVASFSFLVGAARSMHDQQELRSAGMLHLITSLTLPIVLFALYVEPPFLAVLAVGYALPLLTHAWLPGALRWGISGAAYRARRRT